MKTFLNLSDQDLMLKYKQGDYMAFEVLYSRHEARVYSFLFKRLRDKNSVNEVFQNIFLKLHKQRHRYLDKFLFVKFLYTICRSELLDFYKKKKIDTCEFNETFFKTDVTTTQPTPNIDIQSEAILSTKEQTAMQLRYYSDADFVEISKALNTSTANSRKLVSRALQKLKKKYVGEKQ